MTQPPPQESSATEPTSASPGSNSNCSTWCSPPESQSSSCFSAVAPCRPTPQASRPCSMPGCPGAGGVAVAEALFGDASPGGNCPSPFPAMSGRSRSITVTSRPAAEYGSKATMSTVRALRATHLGSAQLHLVRGQCAEARGDRSADRRNHRCQVLVANTGVVTGDEVVQIYARRLAASMTRPVREFVGFSRITLNPGERRTLTFFMPTDLLGFVDRDMRSVVEPGPVTVSVGRRQWTSQEPCPLS